MKKSIVCVLFCLVACVVPGQEFKYQSNPARTSFVIRNSTAKATVGEITDTSTTFSLDVFVKPILGGGQTQTISEIFPSEIMSVEFLIGLRTSIDYTLPDGVKVHHLGISDDQCDLLRVDNIPDTTQTRNLVVFPKACVEGQVVSVPQIDLTVVFHGQNIKIGYDYVD